MNLKDVIPSRINQTEKDKYCMTLLRYGVLESQTQNQRGQQWFPWAGECGSWRDVVTTFSCNMNKL